MRTKTTSIPIVLARPDAGWDEPANEAASTTFAECAVFMFAKLQRCRGLGSPDAVEAPCEAMIMGARRWWALMLVVLVGCASPANTRDAAAHTEEIAPRFVAGGPDAEMYGATNGFVDGTTRHAPGNWAAGWRIESVFANAV